MTIGIGRRARLLSEVEARDQEVHSEQAGRQVGKCDGSLESFVVCRVDSELTN